MAVIKITSRGTIRTGPNKGQDLKVRCETCGEPELQWVQTNEGWKLIPFGSTDVTGALHALTPHACKRTPVSGFVPATASGTAVDATVIKRIDDLEIARNALETSSTAMQAAMSDLDNKHGALEPKIVALGAKWQADAKVLKAEIAKLNAARQIQVVSTTGKVLKTIGRQHAMFDNAARMLAAIGDTGILNLVGEAGSGKSFVFAALADVLGVDWESFTMNAYTSAMDILGFISPLNGQYVDSPFRRAYEFGKLMCIDEVTRSSVEGASSFNGLTSSPQTGFPDRIVERHANCYFVAAANTYGRGADAEYVGGNQLDAATLSRFVYLPWNTDWDFLGEITGLVIPSDAPEFPAPGLARESDDPMVTDWGAWVKRVRDICDEKHIHAVIGARAVINGVKLLKAGIDSKYKSAQHGETGLVEFSTVWAHMDGESASEVRANL